MQTNTTKILSCVLLATLIVVALDFFDVYQFRGPGNTPLLRFANREQIKSDNSVGAILNSSKLLDKDDSELWNAMLKAAQKAKYTCSGNETLPTSINATVMRRMILL